MSSALNVFKIGNLCKPTDFDHWRRKVVAIISSEDPALFGLKDAPTENDMEQYRHWQALNAEAKFTIVHCLGDSALAKTHVSVDDRHTSAGKLWKESIRIYTMSSL